MSPVERTWWNQKLLETCSEEDRKAWLEAMMGNCGKEEKEWLLNYLFSMKGGELIPFGRSLLPVDESLGSTSTFSEQTLEELETLRKANQDLTALVNHLRQQLDNTVKEKALTENQLSILSSLSDNKTTSLSVLVTSMENLKFQDLHNLVVEMLNNLDEGQRMQILRSVIGGMTDQEVLGVTLHTISELSKEDNLNGVKFI